MSGAIRSIQAIRAVSGDRAAWIVARPETWPAAMPYVLSRCLAKASRCSARETSGWAIGWTYFAATMMILIGSFQAIAGLVGLFDDNFYVATRNYVFQFDTTTWGWIHLIWGVVVAIAGGYLLTGSVIARTIGVLMALGSAVAGFAWLPYYPVWGVTIIAIAVSVIWALTAHGRDIAADYD